jgi:hypothetical protein
MEYRVRVNMLGAAAVLAVGVVISIVTSTIVASRAYQSRARESLRREQEVMVRGSARTRVRSDLAVWKIEIRGEGKELQATFGELEAGAARLLGYLKDHGFAEAEIAGGPVETSMTYGHDDRGRDVREQTWYTLSRPFTITTPKVEAVASAAGEVTQLLRENIRVASAKPAFYYSKIADMKIQILGDASRDAKSRADEIAKNSGCRVAEVRRAQMGIIQITEPNSTDVSGSGMYDTGTIDKDVSVVVTLTLGLS